MRLRRAADWLRSSDFTNRHAAAGRTRDIDFVHGVDERLPEVELRNVLELHHLRSGSQKHAHHSAAHPVGIRQKRRQVRIPVGALKDRALKSRPRHGVRNTVSVDKRGVVRNERGKLPNCLVRDLTIFAERQGRHVDRRRVVLRLLRRRERQRTGAIREHCDVRTRRILVLHDANKYRAIHLLNHAGADAVIVVCHHGGLVSGCITALIRRFQSGDATVTSNSDVLLDVLKSLNT